MYHFMYETRNLINGMTYIGIHSTNNLNERVYFGSGLRLKIAIKKYGRTNFSRSILEFFNTRTEALEREEEIVNKDFLNNNKVYNLIAGGVGEKSDLWGSAHKINKGKKYTEEHCNNISKALSGRELTKDHCNNISISCKGRDIWNKGLSWNKEVKDKIAKKLYGVKQSDETRLKKSKILSGRKYMNNGKENRKILLNEVPYFLSLGYVLGKLEYCSIKNKLRKDKFNKGI